MDIITVIFAGSPDWAQQARAALPAGYQLLKRTELAGYGRQLVETRAAMILVDGALDDWQRWTSVPKSNAATRRIPVILVSEDAEQRSQAPKAGADFAFAPSDFLREFPRLLREVARVPDPAILAELQDDCQGALPPLAQEGVRKFNAGEYYKQHDLFEELWMATESPVRDLYRAILQVGVGYYQIQRGNYRGALKMLQRSVQWLLVLPDECQGVNVKKLREDSFRVREELERLGEGRFHEFDPSLIQGVEWQPGDEA